MKNTMNTKKIEAILKGGVDTMNQQLINSLVLAIDNAKEAGVPSILLRAGKRTLTALERGTAGQEEYAMAISALKMSTSSAVIEDSETLLKFAKAIKAKAYLSFPSIVLKRDNKSQRPCGTIAVNSAPMSRAFSGAEFEETIIVPMGVGYTQISQYSFAPFTKKFMSVKFESENDLKVASDHGFKIVYAGIRTICCTYNPVQRFWENISNGKRYTEEELNAYAAKHKGDIRLYKCFVYSPSDTRNISYAAMDVTVEDNREEYLNSISNGAWNIVKETASKMQADGVSSEKIEGYILKAMPRFGQLKAGSTNLGNIESWAFYNGNFETSCGTTIDGTAYLRASYVAARLTEILGIYVSESAVTGLFIQCRPDMQKGAYLVVNDFSFDEMLESLSNVAGLRYFGSKKNSMKPNMIVDENIVKVDSNYHNHDIYLELLEIAASSSAHYSKQMHEKPMHIDAEAAGDFAFYLGQAHVTKRYEAIFNAAAAIPTPGEVTKAYVSDLVAKIAPEVIVENPAILRSLLKNATQSNVNAIDKMKFDIDGSNARLISDYSELMVGSKGRENAIVKYEEIWMPHAATFFTRKYRTEAMDEIKANQANGVVYTKEEAKEFINSYIDTKMMDTKICMIKYPSMGVKEYYLARPLTLKEIKSRINALNIPANKKKALFLMFKEQSNGVAMLPAVKLVMFQCAGLDYDYDGATFIYDQRYCEILNRVKPAAVNVE